MFQNAEKLISKCQNLICVTQVSIQHSGQDRFRVFGSVKTNSCLFACLVRFVWDAVEAVDRTPVRTKQPEKVGLGPLPVEPWFNPGWLVCGVAV